MKLSVFLFAALREGAGRDSIVVELPQAGTVADLRQRIAEALPTLASLLSRSALAVNHQYADETQILNERDEIAVIPPVSGG